MIDLIFKFQKSSSNSSYSNYSKVFLLYFKEKEEDFINFNDLLLENIEIITKDLNSFDFDNKNSSTNNQEHLNILKSNLVYETAVELNCLAIMTSDSSDIISINSISDICLGKG